MPVFHADLMNPEGPVRLDDGTWLLVEMHESRGWVCRISADGRETTVLAPTGEILRRIALHGTGPTNVCFGAPGEQQRNVTEQGSGAFEVHAVGTDGVALLRG